MYNFDDVLIQIKANPMYLCNERNFKKKFSDIYIQILKLSFPSDFKFSQKLYHFLYDDIELKLGTCPICGKRCPYRNFILGYRHHCSQKCSAIDVNTREKCRRTCQSIYGHDNPMKSQIVQEKFRQTCQEKYGHDTNLQCEETKEKIKVTNNIRYGCDNVFQNEEIKEKSRQTKLERYGDENYNNRDKCKETCLDLYGFENPMQNEDVQEKYRQTCREKYNKDYYMQTDEFREKSKETCLDLYGDECYSKTDECDKKMRNTNLERRGVEYPAQSKNVMDKKKQTCVDKYGTPSYSQTDEFKEKVRQTNMDRYGVPSYAQTHEFHKCHRKRVEYNGLTFDSSWEVDVYKFCQENDIPCEYQPDIQFEYECDGKTHVYQPDFLINGKIYEVKGEQFFDGNKMINPYNRVQDSLFESKHQCMISNNVIILRKEQIDRLASGENIFEVVH